MNNQKRQNLQAFNLLVENLTDLAIFFVGKDERICYWNSGAQRIFGYTEEEISDNLSLFFIRQRTGWRASTSRR